MRIAVMVGGVLAAFAFIYHFGRGAPALEAGYWRATARPDTVLALLGAGLLASRAGSPPIWASVLGVAALTAGAAFLATRGLRVPEAPVALTIAIVASGLASAYDKKPEGWVAMAILLLVGVIGGYLQGVGVGPTVADVFFGGLFLGALSLTLLGAALGELGAKVASLKWLVAAAGGAVAGVGLYLALARLGQF